MKTLLRFIAFLGLSVAAFGATPAFQSFDTNDFVVLPSLAQPQRITARRTQTTNVFNGDVVIYTNSIITNVTTLIVNTNVTNITEGSLVINTNVLIENNYTTNIVDNSTMIVTNSYITINNTTNFIDNSTIIITNTTITINGTNVATFGDLVFTNSAGFIYSVSPHTTMSVTNLTSDQTLTAGGALITTAQSAVVLTNGTNVVDTLKKALIYLIGTDTNNLVQLSTGNGAGAHLWLLNASTNSTFTLASGPLSDNPSLNVYVRGGIWQPTELGESLELLGVGGGWDEVNRANPLGPAPAVGVNYWTNLAGVLQSIDLTLPLMVTNQIQFGPGTTNFLKKISALGQFNVLTYFDNGGSQYATIGLEATDGVAGTIAGYRNGTYGGIQITGNDFVEMAYASGPNITLDSSGFRPSARATVDLGTVPISWRNLAIDGTENVIGFYSAGDYSRLAISHTGTNGAVVFDSQASGSAGVPRQYEYHFNGETNAWLFQGGTWMLGKNSLAAYGVPSNGESIISIRDTSKGDPDGQESFWKTLSDSTHYGFVDLLMATTESTVSVLNRSAGNTASITLRTVATDPSSTYIDVNTGRIFAGSGSPEGALTAIPGGIYMDLAGSALYFKTNGVGNTGWGKLAFQ